MRTVGQIVDVVQEWVDNHACQLPDFCGAYLFGGIAGMPRASVFADYRDVDLLIVLSSESKGDEENLEVSYKNVSLEGGFGSLQDHSSPETILAHPGLAPNFAVTTILADPLGILRPMQRVVAREYSRKHWLVERCKVERQAICSALVAAKEAGGIDEGGLHLWEVLNYLTGLLAVARLKRPTHRRSLVLLKELLSQDGRLDLHERALQVWGSVDLSVQEVQGFLHDAAMAYGRAVAVKRTPTPYTFKLHAHLRPYFIEGSQEMIDEGYHREAMYWIVAAFDMANTTLQRDAPDKEKACFQQTADRLLRRLGWYTQSDWRIRMGQAEGLADDIIQLADAIIDNYHDVSDSSGEVGDTLKNHVR